MKKTIEEIFIIIFISLLTAILFNTFYGKGINVKKFNPAPQLKKDAKKAGIKTIDIKRAKELFDRGAIFVDARPPEEFKSGRVKNSFNIPEGVEREYFKNFSLFCPPDSNMEIVVYCSGKDCHASLDVAEFLKKKGYKKIYVFLEGWEKWMESGYPVEWN